MGIGDHRLQFGERLAQRRQPGVVGALRLPDVGGALQGEQFAGVAGSGGPDSVRNGRGHDSAPCVVGQARMAGPGRWLVAGAGLVISGLVEIGAPAGEHVVRARLRVVGGGQVAGRVAGAEQPIQQGARQAPEGASRTGTSRTAASSWSAVNSRAAPARSKLQRGDHQPEDVGQPEFAVPLAADRLADAARVAPHHHHPLLVEHRSVVGEPVDLVEVRGPTDLGDDEFETSNGLVSVVNTVPRVWA